MKNSYSDTLPFAALLFAWWCAVCACDMMALESYVSIGIAPTVTNGEFKWAMNMSSVSGSVRGDKTNAWGMEINAFRSNYSRLCSTIFLYSKCWWTWIPDCRTWNDISPCSAVHSICFQLRKCSVRGVRAMNSNGSFIRIIMKSLIAFISKFKWTTR